MDHVVVWDGALDKKRQMEARAGVAVKRRCTFSLIGETGHQVSALQAAIDRSQAEDAVVDARIPIEKEPCD